jgi:hypothetical protein
VHRLQIKDVHSHSAEVIATGWTLQDNACHELEVAIRSPAHAVVQAASNICCNVMQWQFSGTRLADVANVDDTIAWCCIKPALLALVFDTGMAGVPPQLAVLSLAYNVNLFGSLTHYASGQAAVYCSSGFIRTDDVFVKGFTCAVTSLTIWGGAGMLWWKVLGWY